MFLWSSSRGKTRLYRGRMRPSLPKIWPPISCRDTSQNRCLPLPLSQPSLLCVPQTPPHRRRICSDPGWTRPSPSTLCYTACGHLVPLRIWMCLPATAGARWSALTLRHLHDPATPPLPVMLRPALRARPPPPPPLMRNGKGCPFLASVFLLMVKLGQMVMRTSGRHCTSWPDGRLLHRHGSSLPPTPNTLPPMLLPHPACGSTEVL